MVKHLLYSLAFATVPFVGYLQAAENGSQSELTAYGVGLDGYAYSFNPEDPASATQLQQFSYAGSPLSFGNDNGSGTSAGDVYYAMTETEDNSTLMLASINFTTGNVVKLGKGTQCSDLCYDAESKTLYGSYLDGSRYDGYVARIYSFDATGAKTEVYASAADLGYQFQAIAPGAKDQIYAFNVSGITSKTVTVYLVDAKAGTCSKVMDFTDKLTCYDYPFSADSHDGKLYFIAGKKVFTVDPAAGTETMSTTKFTNKVIGLCFTQSTADAGVTDTPAQEEKPVRLINKIETIGDIMGDEPGQVTRIENCYYDVDNHLVRVGIYGKMLGKDQFELSRYGYYTNDANGNCTRKAYEQYGPYDNGDMAYKWSNDSANYTYDAAGRLATESTSNSRTTYTYDEEGNLIESVKESYNKWSNTYTMIQTLTYSEFVAPGCPEIITSTGAYESYAYTGQCTYDDNYNKTSELHYVNKDNEFVLTAAEYWTYDGDFLTTYERKYVTNGEEADYVRTIYTMVDGDSYRIKAQSQNFMNGQWYDESTATVTTYMDAPEGEMYASQLVADPAEEVGKVNLIFSVPEYAYLGTPMFVIYDRGVALDTVAVAEVFNGLDACNYTVNNVKNGFHEYMVQSCIGITDEVDELGDATIVGIAGRNVSNIVSTNVEFALPAVTNLHGVKTEMNEYDEYNMTIAWDAPADAEMFGLQRYDVLVVGRRTADNYGQNSKETTWTINDIASESIKVCIQAIYTYGKSVSDTIEFKPADFLPVSKVKRLTHIVESWGDPMGGTDARACTKKTISYFDKNNRLSRQATYAKAVGKDEWTISNYTKHIYNEQGQRTQIIGYNYGYYDEYDGDFGPRESYVNNYEYNELGQCVKAQLGKNEHLYEYDEDGNLVKDTYIESGFTSKPQIITYSNFFDKNCPQRVESTGRLMMYKYILDRTYNDDCKLVCERKWDADYTRCKTEQHWYYDATGAEICDSTFTVETSNGVETLVDKSTTSYTPEENDPNRVKVYTRTWDDIMNMWSTPKVWSVNVMMDAQGDLYDAALESEVVADAKNEVKHTVTVPEALANSTYGFNLYRNGMKVAGPIAYTDEEHLNYDDMGIESWWVLTDSLIPNGEYEYFVELVKMDKAGNEIETYNISNINDVELDLELPACGAPEYVSHVTTTDSYTDDEGEVVETEMTNVTIQWAPADTTGYYFKRYNIFIEGISIPDNMGEEDSDATTYTISSRGYNPLNLYVQTQYMYGKVNSDVTSIDIEEIATGVKMPIANTGVSAMLLNKVVTLSQAVDHIDVYALDGSHVAGNDKASSLDLNALAAGTYVISVEQNRALKVMKVVIK